MRVLGRLNVNRATAEELRKIPAMDASTVELILKTRAQAPFKSLDALAEIKQEVRRHLKVEGDSDLRIIRPLPLVVIQ